MRLFYTFIAALFLFQAAGLGELFCAEQEACHAEAGAGHEADHKESPEDAACHWHCACVHAAQPLMRAVTPPLPSAAPGPALVGAFAFVPVPPCASIFHPPA